MGIAGENARVKRGIVGGGTEGLQEGQVFSNNGGMADLFIVKARLKLMLWFVGVGFLGALLSTWHFLNQLEVGGEEGSFYMSAVVAGALALAWMGLVVFYFMAGRVYNPYRNIPRGVNFPWWTLKVLLVVAVLVAGGIGLHYFSKQLEGEFNLLREGELETLKERIQLDPALLEKPDGKGGGTLVQVAYRENHPQAVALLLASGASREGLDAAGRNPLVASLGNVPMLRILLDAGFDPDGADGGGNRPLHVAVGQNNQEAVNALLGAGAAVDILDANSRTPLMQAIEGDNLPVAGLLLENGADVNAFDRRGDTALHRAVRKRNPESIRMLLGKGADPRRFNFTHMTPLHIVVRAGHNDLVSIFLEIPDMTGLHDEADATPLDLALKAHQYETAELLIEAGADIDRILANGDTLMHTTILARDYRTTRFLINQGGRLDVPNAAGETAFDVLRRKQLAGLIEMVQMRDNPEAFTNAVDSAEAVAP